MNPQVSVILVNYNGFSDTVDCVASLKNVDYDNMEIIVVDNSSTVKPDDEQRHYLEENTRYIEGTENLGFSGGNNLGAKYALSQGAEYILLLNNDTVVEKNFLRILVDAAQAHLDAGIVCGKILYHNPERIIWYAGGGFNPTTFDAWHIGHHQKDEDMAAIVKSVEFATGCLQLIPAKVWQKVGELSNEYFLYCEDTDYCVRIRKAGYQIYYCSDAVIYHKVSQSTGAASDNTQYYMTRNQLYLIQKYSDNRCVGYLNFLLRRSVDVLRRRRKLCVVISAVCDFIQGKKGKRRQ